MAHQVDLTRLDHEVLFPFLCQAAVAKVFTLVVLAASTSAGTAPVLLADGLRLGRTPLERCLLPSVKVRTVGEACRLLLLGIWRRDLCFPDREAHLAHADPKRVV